MNTSDSTRCLASISLILLASRAAPAEESAKEICLTLHSRISPAAEPVVSRAGQPVTWPFTFGVPFRKGTLAAEDGLHLLSADGAELPLQVRRTAEWPDGSVRWALVDCQAALNDRPVTLRLMYGVPKGPPAALQPKVFVREQEDSVTVNTGKLEFLLAKQNVSIFQRVSVLRGDGRRVEVLPEDAHSDFWLEDQSGKVHRGSWAEPPQVVVEESGPLRVAVKIEGWTQAEDGRKLGRHIVRAHAFAGCTFLRMYHTFVNTADSNEVQFRNIAFKLPFRGNQYRFAGVGESARRAVKNSDYLLQYRHNEYEFVSDGTSLAKGQRAAGSVTVSSDETAYTVSVRHFSQNFPKEIEIEPNWLKLHFWPRHGKPAVHLGETMTAKNIGFLWWVHEGEMLDFRLPEEVYKFSYTQKHYDNIRASRQSNAFGIAKTHEYLLDFHGGHQDAGGDAGAAGVHTAIFRANPMITVEPQWLADSGAFYGTAPRSDEYEQVEHAIERTLLFLPAMMERMGDYGMWNFGSYHQSYLPTLDAAGIHRHWPGFHHGGPRWPWLVFVRSGEPRFYDFAEAHSRHLMDTCTSNWEDAAYNKKYWKNEGWWGSNMSLKYRGGLCRYKGLVHWFAGMRMFYNCQADYALWHYYLTGYQRAWDVAMAHGEFLLRARDQIDDTKSKAVYLGRSGMARGSMAITLYDATRDERYLNLAREQMALLLQNSDEKPGEGYREIYYAPFVERYLAVVGDDKLKQHVIQWARDRMAEQRAWNGRDQFYSLMALGYQFTGEVEFLKYGLAQARVMLEDRSAESEPILEGVIPSAFSGAVGYLGQQWGDFVRALDEHHRKTGERLLLPERPDCLPCRSELWASTSKTAKEKERTYRLVFHTRKRPEEAINISYSFRYGDVAIVTVEGPDGEVLARKEIASEEGKVRYAFRVPAEGRSGDYRVEFFCPKAKGYFKCYLPIRGQYTKLVFEQPFWLREGRGACRFHFCPTVKAGKGVGAIRLQTRIRDKSFQTHRIYRSDGELFWAKTERGHVNAPTDTTIKIEPQFQGKPWMYSLGGLGKSDGVMLSGDVLPVVAIDRDQFFIPDRFRETQETE